MDLDLINAVAVGNCFSIAACSLLPCGRQITIARQGPALTEQQHRVLDEK